MFLKLCSVLLVLIYELLLHCFAVLAQHDLNAHSSLGARCVQPCHGGCVPLFLAVKPIRNQPLGIMGISSCESEAWEIHPIRVPPRPPRRGPWPFLARRILATANSARSRSSSSLSGMDASHAYTAASWACSTCSLVP
jgi:hypothetical protein